MALIKNCADDIWLHPWPITSVLPRHLFTDRLCSLSFSASFCWQRWHDCTSILGPRVMVRAVSASRHLRFGTCCHLISRTVMLVVNSSSRALRLGSLCKPTHKRRLWELCLSGALQILDLIDWLISTVAHCDVAGWMTGWSPLWKFPKYTLLL